jgi:plasmid stabilization system protein ParE
MPVLFHRLALREYRRAIAAYRRQDVEVVDRFIRAVEGAAARIDDNPSLGSPCFVAFRWVLVKKFKYVLYYRQLSDSLNLIYAVAHPRRRPGYWLGRIRRR